MKFSRIGTKMLTVLLMVSTLSMFLLSVISYNSSKVIINDQIQKNMNAELKAQINNILLKTDKISTIASQIARSVESDYTTKSLKQYETMLKKAIYESDLAYGSGIWFEPYAYNKNEKYVGPYVYKDGNNPVVTYDYSNAKYNYFSYDWYTNAMKGSKKPIFSKLYYDSTLKTTMATCSVPMYDSNHKFLGVITVDMNIKSIQNLVRHTKVGKAGKVTLLTNEGMYVTNDAADKVMKENIQKEKNKSLSLLGKKMIGRDNGNGEFNKEHKDYMAYFGKVGKLGWKIMIEIPKSEINQPVNALLRKLIIISMISLLLLILVISMQVRVLTKNVNKVRNFALKLSDGDYTINEIKINSKDELGQMGEALNKMMLQNKSVIQTISEEAKEVGNVSIELNHTTENLTNNFDKIEGAIKSINEDMMSSSAATEEVNASVEEVNASINILTQETNNSSQMSAAIKERASQVQKRSTSSFEKAMNLTNENEKNLNQSIEEAKIVETIGIMAAKISEIAEQVNLLSLNASIEAARAGEQGKGFAVVAKEIGNLASQTKKSVDDISQTTDKVKSAFNNLMDNARQLLSFIEEVVTPDYKTFVEVGNQYDKDAEDISSSAEKISDMSDNIERIIREITEAIQGIASEAESTASSSLDIINNMEKVSAEIDNIEKTVMKEKFTSDNLDKMVNKFKIV